MALDVSIDHLEGHGLFASKASRPKPTSFQLPPLQGKDLGEHFWTIGRRVAHPWLEYANSLSTSHIGTPPSGNQVPDPETYWTAESWHALDTTLQASVPVLPACFARTPGWTKYPFLRVQDGDIVGLGDPIPVPYPDTADTALVFDVEVMTKESPYPVMATAVSQNAWYSWVSPWLAQDGERYEMKSHLIPMGPRDGSAPPRLIICHNAGFDRAAVVDEYSLQSTNIRWLDTMSLHVATNGISSPQRAAWTEHYRARALKRLQAAMAEQQFEEDARAEIKQLLESRGMDDEALGAIRLQALGELSEELQASLQESTMVFDSTLSAPDTLMDDDQSQVLWQDITSKNSLADVAALHCGIHLEKETRNVFIDGTPREEVWAQLPSLLAYCATDVSTTFAVFKKVWPAFIKSCPHPVTVAGVLGLGSTFLPVDTSWVRYQENAQAKFKEMNARVVSTLKDMAESLMQAGVEAIENDASRDDRWWETDPWYGQLDWSPKKPKLIDPSTMVPLWWRDKIANAKSPLSARIKVVPLLLQLRCDGNPVCLSENGKQWVVLMKGERVPLPGSPLSQAVLKKHAITSDAGTLGEEILEAISQGNDRVSELLRQLADHVRTLGPGEDPRLQQLPWQAVPYQDPTLPAPWWPKWYWDLYDSACQDLDITIRAKVAPLLLKIAWDGAPVFRSREHGWVYRTTVPKEAQAPLTFTHEADAHLCTGYFYKLPHANGDGSNVGNPFSKSFLPYFESGRLKSLHGERGGEAARDALEMNAQCSYWISAHDRIEKQFVVWDGEADTRMGFTGPTSNYGLILPQVISMGTVTRRAIEKTWLTASNAKKNRIGSELKSMIKAPPGWSIVGADVDSEELWICSVMGDAQFGIHGATAIGWMTLEGSKAEGTDLHSKTASILGTSRNQAKVFNYSRIYGAGIRHAMHLLLKANPSMPVEEAGRRAKQLYAATKGQTTRSNALFGRKFWYGGTESFVFNKLEEIALSDEPKTPALDCGITAALSKRFLPKGRGQSRQDYMPSRINWVVQSSGVDYLHLLLTAMDHLCSTYDIQARFMLSVHDEVRYLARDEDRYRAALALQVANLWTRSMFAFKLNMDDLPESCAFFAAVDIDHVLRKEVDDPCVTPSQPEPIPPGESLDIHAILARTNGSLFRDQRPMPQAESIQDIAHIPGTLPQYDPGVPTYVPSSQQHRCVGERGLLFLQAQATTNIDEIRTLDRRIRRRQSAAMTPNKSRMYSTKVHATIKVEGATFLALEAMLPPRPLRRKVLARQQSQPRIPRPQPRPPRKPKDPSRRIHISGALLPPSLFNKPMLRYKPEQPLSMTMMIRARRRARLRRLQQWDEVQEMKQLTSVEAATHPHDAFYARPHDWRTYETTNND